MDFVANDTNSTYKKLINDRGTESLIDLTGYTVTLRWRYTETGAMTKSASMTNSNQTTNKGEATYRWAAGELLSPAMWEDVVVTENSSGRIVTQLEEVRLSVRAKAIGP